ncbi:hypothetical protein Mapa_001595 [Marchantia paleacea]|nr:hypothetical protein Mapa_001595 [Marchantia paleacea]
MLTLRSSLRLENRDIQFTLASFTSNIRCPLQEHQRFDVITSKVSSTQTQQTELQQSSMIGKTTALDLLQLCDPIWRKPYM